MFSKNGISDDLGNNEIWSDGHGEEVKSSENDRRIQDLRETEI